MAGLNIKYLRFDSARQTGYDLLTTDHIGNVIMYLNDHDMTLNDHLDNNTNLALLPILNVFCHFVPASV